MIFALVLIIGFIVLSKIPTKDVKAAPYKAPPAKTCPPHQWYWQEIKDEHGVVQMERITCRVCGPRDSENV